MRSFRSSFARGIQTVGTAILVSVAVLFLSAFNLEPISAELEPTGRGSVHTFRITNPSSEPVAIRLQVLTRSEDANGTEVNTPADDLFVLYPSRILIPPQGIQLVRLQWKGNPNPDRELAFRLLAEQLPVEFQETRRTGGAIRILTRYLGSIYVVPPEAKPDIQIFLHEGKREGKALTSVKLEFQNKGTAHAILNDLVVELSSTDRKWVVPEDLLRGISGENLLAGAQRICILPLPIDLQVTDVSSLSVTFRYEVIR